MSALIIDGFFLVQADPVIAQVKVQNVIGWSIYSSSTVSGALIEVTPYGLAAPT